LCSALAKRVCGLRRADAGEQTLEQFLRRLPQSDAHKEKIMSTEFLLREHGNDDFIASYDPLGSILRRDVHLEMSMVFSEEFKGVCVGCGLSVTASEDSRMITWYGNLHTPATRFAYLVPISVPSPLTIDLHSPTCSMSMEILKSKPGFIDPLSELMSDDGVVDDERPLADHFPDFIAHMVNLSSRERLDPASVLEELNFKEKTKKPSASPADFLRVVLCSPGWPTMPSKSRIYPLQCKIEEIVSTLFDGLDTTKVKFASQHITLLRRLPALQHDIEWRLRLIISSLSTLPNQFHWRVCRYRALAWMVFQLLENMSTCFGLEVARLPSVATPLRDDKSYLAKDWLNGFRDAIRTVVFAIWFSWGLHLSDLWDGDDSIVDPYRGWLKVLTADSLCNDNGSGEAVGRQEQMISALVCPTVWLETTARATATDNPRAHLSLSGRRVYSLSSDSIQTLLKHNRQSQPWLFSLHLSGSLRRTQKAIVATLEEIAGAFGAAEKRFGVPRYLVPAIDSGLQ